jgi:hypothetical protein
MRLRQGRRMRLDSAPDALTARASTTRGLDPLSDRRLRQSIHVNIGVPPMKKLLAAMIAASFACGVAYAADAAKDAKKPTAEDCKKAKDAGKKLDGCETAKKDKKGGC